MFEGKFALVTGAASGIGRETVRLLGRQGAKLFVVDRDAEGLDRLELELRQEGIWFEAFLVDVSDRGRMEKLAAEVHERVEALDLLVNNAGVLVTGGYRHASLDAWDRVISVNLMGVVYGSRLFVPAMERRGSGVVVNVASASGLVGFPALTAYATSKFGVVGLTLSMRGELDGKGVSINAVCPGLVRTEIAKHSGASEAEQGEVKKLLDRHGIEPEVVAEAILDAAMGDRGVVTVGGQAKALDVVSRLARNWTPALLTRIGKMNTFR